MIIHTSWLHHLKRTMKIMKKKNLKTPNYSILNVIVKIGQYLLRDIKYQERITLVKSFMIMRIITLFGIMEDHNSALKRDRNSKLTQEEAFNRKLMEWRCKYEFVLPLKNRMMKIAKENIANSNRGTQEPKVSTTTDDQSNNSSASSI